MKELRLENGAKARQKKPELCPYCEKYSFIRDPNAFTSDKLREHNIRARDIDFITKRTIIDNTEVQRNRTGVLDTEDRKFYLREIDERKRKYTGIGDYGADITVARRLKKSTIAILVVDPTARRCCYKLCSSTKKYKDLAAAKWKGPVDDEEFFRKLAKLDEDKKSQSKRQSATR